MEKRMERSLIYNGTITAEQFLFYEIRIASKYYLDGTSVEDAIEEIKKNNLFQYPTERLVARMVRSCYKRLDALDDEQLRQELSSAPAEIAKQINLYAMMRYNRIVWDFMVGVIGEKFRSQDFEFSRKDLKRHLASYKGVYLRLHERTFQYIEPKDIAQLYIRAKENHSYRYSFVDYTTDDGIVEQPVTPNSKQIYYEASQDNFSKIPGSPVAYWVSSATLQTFAYPSIGQIARPRQGLATGCNDIFIRLWYEVNEEKVNYMAENLDSAVKSQKKWFPYNKGGDYRRWYGNNEYLVNWERDGFEIRHFVDEKGKLRSRPQNTQYYFHRCISWSLISSGRVAFRYKPDGHIFDVSGMSCFTESNLLYLLGLCNTPVVDEFLSIFSPTINFQAGDIANIPVAIEVDKIEDVEKVVSENIQVSKKDWDSYETSWDFTRNPLV